MATKPQSSFDRIRDSNGNAYDPNNNPGGLAQGGHRQNFVPDLNAVADVAEYAASVATEAATAATSATNSASAAAGSATNAASSATDASNSAARFQGTSTTSNTPSLASKSFTTQPNKAFTVGTFLLAQSRATSALWMFGKVVSYNSSTGALVLAVEAIGTTIAAATDWDILVTGARGVVGPDSWSTPVAWAASIDYSASPPRSTVVYDGETYVATTSHTSGSTFDSTKWIKIAQKGSQLSKATGAILRALTDDASYLTAKSHADAMAYDVRTNVSVSTTPNLSSAFNFSFTITGNLSINAGTNSKEGSSGLFALKQDATGGRTVSWNTFWDFGADGPPTIRTTAGATDYVFYVIKPGATGAICTYKAGA
jgi:hypothetical protein